MRGRGRGGADSPSFFVMSELNKSYNPEGVEEKWYEHWIAGNLFVADPASGKTPYSIVIPPPNVTGSLHMGHALNTTLQDILIRWKRMSGFDALWVPGMDHAGIATQNVVERQLVAEKADRHTLGREAFTERVWKWKAEYGGRIIHQLKRLGASCDWTRERFTLDAGLSEAVVEVFVSLYQQGLIYRDKRLINWCPRCLTALSDIEVEHEEYDGRLTFIKYPLEDGSGYITVATTRPETMLGDMAVAVNPEDSRYAHMIGKRISLPLTARKIPVIADSAVDTEFGTGAVKVTPAHDFNDEAIAKRQNPQLDFITVIGPDGRMTAEAGPKYAGLDRYEARKAVLDDLKAMELIAKQDKYLHSISQCYRCKTVIEPLSTLQWYVKVGPLASAAMDAVRDGRIRIIPKAWENTYFSWMENINDWCISRQIWWGHRIPAWYCDNCEEVIVSRKTPSGCTKCGGQLRQDEDVLDTWFSSALWPFSTLGWPADTPELRKYYPTSALVTGFDIIFFWVARMIMMGLKFRGDVPFRDVYIHALVRDASGQKMSKSKGNVIDPLIMMEKYGTDAFRFTLAAFAAQGRDVKFAEERVEGYRHFVNKLWNASRFILLNTGGEKAPDNMSFESLDIGSRWILSRLAATAVDVNAALGDYRFNDAANSIYQFIWRELCDWYIEMVKPVLYEDSDGKERVKKCLLFVLDNTLRLLHPFMPYVTEEIWQHVAVTDKQSASIVTAHYPALLQRDEGAEAEMDIIMETVTGIRTIRGELNLSPSLELRACVKTQSDKAEDVLKRNLAYLNKLARADISEIGAGVRKPGGAAAAVRDYVEVYVPLEGLLNIELEIDRLRKDEAKVEETIAFLNKKLLNEDFLSRAPQAIIAKEKEKYEECLRKKDRVLENIRKLYEVGGKK
ncbi:Valine--tRNA ligase [Candidatus Sulfobium mesophilum]|uniref:Valine--tRNA ligase n=1 Tax=Candidatus Sulfobium mesophilum TaxID=2016548 RepID=A0A2U3QIM0_9BACT|nr:Valine--tRNA ligase [Candidatus Sulfobium mesophilum]